MLICPVLAASCNLHGSFKKHFLIKHKSRSPRQLLAGFFPGKVLNHFIVRAGLGALQTVAGDWRKVVVVVAALCGWLLMDRILFPVSSGQ